MKNKHCADNIYLDDLNCVINFKEKKKEFLKRFFSLLLCLKTKHETRTVFDIFKIIDMQQKTVLLEMLRVLSKRKIRK